MSESTDKLARKIADGRRGPAGVGDPPDSGGMKYDQGKPRFDLLPPEAWTMGLTTTDLEGVVRVLEFGAQKYTAHSWQTVPEAERRYAAAAGRHTAHRLSEGDGAIDPESGLPARWHNLCDAVFLFALAARALGGRHE